MPKAQAANDWRTRVWREFRAGNLTRAMRDVLLTLHTYRGTGGLCVPAHATLADRARCCVRTVQRALQAAQDLGLVTWCERRVRRGWRWLRTSNSYRLRTPADDVQAGMRPSWRAVSSGAATTGLRGRREENQNKKAALQAMLEEAAAVPGDLLAMRRAAFEAQMKARMAERHQCSVDKAGATVLRTVNDCRLRLPPLRGASGILDRPYAS